MFRSAQLRGLSIVVWAIACGGKVVSSDGTGTAGSGGSAGSTSAGAATSTSGTGSGATTTGGTFGSGATSSGVTTGGTTTGIVTTSAATTTGIMTGAGGSSVSGTGGAGGMGGVIGKGGAGGTGGVIGKGGAGGTGGKSGLSKCGGDCPVCISWLSPMDGYLNRDDCGGPLMGFTCAPLGCMPNQPSLLKEQHWQLTGGCVDTSKRYAVALHIYGVVECKAYAGNYTRANPMESADRSVVHNLWIAGGADTASRWNTYAITVTSTPSSALPGRDGTPDGPVYFMNQCPPGASEDLITWKIDYATSVVVPGGAWINYVEHDDDCNMNANCGAETPGASCVDRHVVPIPSTAVPPPPASFVQPIQNAQRASGQWWFVDVTSVMPL